MKDDINTERRIKEAAKRVFIKKGLAGARMQEIADEAEINKSMLHYYYRNKELLFKKIFEEAIQELAPKILSILGEELPLREKIEKFVSGYLDTLMVNPFLPLFLFSELRNQPRQVVEKIGIRRSGMVENITRQLKTEIQAGKIKPIAPMHFLVNLMSLSVFPFVAQPLLQEVFDMDEKAFQEFIEARKREIPEFIMSSISIKP